jgi:hypothetical protein
MHTFSHEDTMISSQSRRSDPDQDLSATIKGADGKRMRGNMLTRTRTLFRALGERVGSFELSRQIYG